MARLHIIYDKRGNMETQQLPKDQFKIAVLDISDELGNDEIKGYVEELGTLLLEQVRLDE